MPEHVLVNMTGEHLSFNAQQNKATLRLYLHVNNSQTYKYNTDFHRTITSGQVRNLSLNTSNMSNASNFNFNQGSFWPWYSMGSANERHYIVTSLIGWDHTQNGSCWWCYCAINWLRHHKTWSADQHWFRSEPSWCQQYLTLYVLNFSEET